MRLLVLGGTAWLGREVAVSARDHGDEVTCLARGDSGAMPPGVGVVLADRTTTEALHQLSRGRWDAVVDVTRQPGQARSAAQALADGPAHVVYVSTISVYADHSRPEAGEDTPLLEPLAADTMNGPADYGAAKVACERHVLEAVGADRCLIVRPGLIAGPGDPTGRAGYWAARFAEPAGPEGRVLVPDAPTQPTQVLDVRDLARWLVTVARERTTGTMDAVGDVVALGEFLSVARDVAGSGTPVPAGPDWLRDRGVAQFSGPRSLPLWLADPDMAGFLDRPGAAAFASGLTARPLAETLGDTLAWERGRPEPATRAGGLTTAEERELLAALAAGG